ncbi:MAG: hypothetical protein VYC76_05020 [Pseudomonadota bacterium]|nr:hypothetical protein [Pseudomonadota bacterium]
MIASENPLETEAPGEEAISDIALEALEAELPALTVLRDFANRASRVSWFIELGEPLDNDCLDVVTLYLERLGLPDASPAPLLDWRDAADAAQSMDINSEAWEIEEQFRAAATAEALTLISEEGLGIMLTHLASSLSEDVANCVEEALYMVDEASSEALTNLAAGAAQQAVHGAALSLAAYAAHVLKSDPHIETIELDNDDIANHPLMLRFRLFEMGRWPVSLIGNSLNLF